MFDPAMHPEDEGWMNEPELTRKDATARIFGHEETEVSLSVRPRSTRWRAIRAGLFVGGGVAAAPVVFLLPPHVAWAAASVLTGGFLGWRKWIERFTLEGIQGRCPRCDGELELETPGRLRPRQTLPCPECGHDLQLVVEGLDRAA